MSARAALMKRFGELLSTISTAGGYSTDFDAEILYWRDPQVDHGKNTLTYRDRSSSVEVQGGAHVHRIQVEVHAYLFGDDLGDQMNKVHEDIIKAVGTDRTLSARHATIDPTGSEYEINGDGYEAALVVVGFQITHKTQAWSTV